MAEALVTISAEGILKKLLSSAADEVALAWGYKEKLTALHDTLDLIRAKLRDAERQKGTEAVMVWLKQLKRVVSDADDVLDEIDYEVLRREVKKRDRMTRKVPSLSFRREMGHKIENINKKLVEINKKAIDLGLQNEQPAGLVPDSLRETDPYLSEEFKIFGREDDELRIIQLLTQTRKEETLTIVPIVGMGGIGKTTLAKSIFHNPKIDQHFDVKAWLCVSVKVDVNTLLAKIYESLAREKPKSQTRVNLITDLQDKLGSKRYLLVLDDVWDEEKAHWDDFRSCMLKVQAESGSGILVTTRSHKIGTKVMSEGFQALEGLSDDPCWSIFQDRAFRAGQSPSPELEKIGRDIVKKCRGLPLLVNVMGGMLRKWNDIEKWLSIKDSKVWDLTEEGERVQNSLKLSFDNLPNSIVKQCFAYCSMFEKDKVMEREELVRLWMALGLVQADERTNKQAEDVGNDIFQILVTSSLFQDVKVDKYGYVTCCMHDLVHDLSISLSKHESLCLVDPTRDDIARITQVKHLAISYPNYWVNEGSITFKEMISVVFKEDMTARTLQTLIFQFELEYKISFQRFKCMRVLKLDVFGLKKIDYSIGELVHLRYLDLSRTFVRVLPESICNLYHLQTLKLYGWLKKWPKNMHKLISLQHLTFIDNRITQRHQIAELGPLKHLAGKLSIENLEMISRKEDAAKANLSAKRNLYHIKFSWSWSSSEGANRNDKDVLEGLQPPQNVKSLEISGFSGDNYPAWVMKMAIDIGGKWMPLHKLVDIELAGCSCLYLPVLENLPLLQNLVLRNMDNLTCLSSPLVEAEIVTGSMKPLSPSLRSLRLERMERLEKWIEAATSNSSTMLSPVLESLSILCCPKIIQLDECHPHPLVSLEISYCENLVSIKSIQGLTSLESLEIEGCPSLLEIGFLQNYEHHPLKSLSIKSCERLTSLPLFDCFSFLNTLTLGRFSEELHSFPSLQGIEKSWNHLRTIRLYGRDHWESIPEEIKHLTSLRELTISGFGMRELPMWLTNMSSIQDLRFYNCKSLVSIKSIQGLTSLESLVIINCPSLLEIGFLQNYEHHPLKLLRIVDNEKLTSVPRFDCFSFLNQVELGPFSEELHSFPSLQGIERSRNHLRDITLYGRDHWESIPEEIKHLTSLTRLIIEGFGMRELPMWLTNLSSIRKMIFIKCRRLDKETVKRGAPRGADHVTLDYEPCK